MTTITYDKNRHTLMPNELNDELLRAARNAPIPAVMLDSIAGMENLRIQARHRAMLAAIPADLPGVQTHSGTPVAYLHTWKNGTRECLSRRLTPVGDDAPADAVVWPLYTHADSEEGAQLRQRVMDLESYQRMFMAAAGDLGDIHDALGLDPDDAEGAAPIIEEIEDRVKRIAELEAQLAASTERVKELEGALRFYANGDHFTLHDPSAWDTVSGEPANFYEDESNTATVEDGSIAKMVLAGTPIPDDDDGAQLAVQPN